MLNLITSVCYNHFPLLKCNLLYLCYIILTWVAMVTEPAEKGLVDPARRLPGLAVGRQVLSTVPQDWV